MVDEADVSHAVRRLREDCAGSVVARPRLAEHTTLRVGGPAAALVEVETEADLAAVADVVESTSLQWLVLGRGSNLLVADGGWPGIVVVLGSDFEEIEITDDTVRAGGAVMLPVLATKAASAGLAGFAWAAAVPGTVGGGVRMNAGAHGGEMADHLVTVDLYRMGSRRREVWPAADLGLSYRHSELPDDAVVVAAELRLEHGAVERTRAEMRDIKQWRRDHQPLTEPSCGSVFTNPEGDSAGRLIEEAGGKELRVGGARVSRKHANFIVTGEGATAADVRALIELVRARVADVSGITLRPEVVMVGDFGTDPVGSAPGIH